MGNMERGGGVAVESEGESAAGAELVPLAAFLPRAMFDMAVVMGRIEKERIGRGRRGKGERVTWLNLQSKTVNRHRFPFEPVRSLLGHSRQR